MTNHPRYSPPPQQSGYRPAPDQPGVPGYAGQGQQHTYAQQYDWRYAQQPPYRQPFNAYGGGQPTPPPALGATQKRSRAGLLTVGAVAIAVVSAAIGGTAASVVQHTAQPGSSTAGIPPGAAPSMPAANAPVGSVEQVAAKVVPSVVMLETDLGRQSEEGSGIILSSDGLILTNNHVVAAAAKSERGGGPGPAGPPGPEAPPGPAAPPGPGPAPKTTVTFSDGRTAPFTVVGADPTTDIAVVRVQGVSGLTPITLGSSANLRVGEPVVAVGS
ncbi:MAG: trypsin-like peptidase domain-containing protein, partial [Mycobacterium sp.]|nr:trypsin-like peptidase domain-containing protein [Mycobacterium sp.]